MVHTHLRAVMFLLVDTPIRTHILYRYLTYLPSSEARIWENMFWTNGRCEDNESQKGRASLRTKRSWESPCRLGSNGILVLQPRLLGFI